MKRLLSLVAAVACSACATDSPPSDPQIIDAEPIPNDRYAESIAQVWCEAREHCGCPPRPNLEACAYEIAQEREALAEELRDAGLVYDPTCAGEQVQRIEVRGCDWVLDLRDDVDPCPVFHGDKPLGVSCSTFGPQQRFSDCDRGLQCWAPYPAPGVPVAGPTCVQATPPPRDEGQSCIDAEASSLAPTLPCVEGRYCNGEVCVPIVGEGDSCERPDACGPAAWCDGLRSGPNGATEPGVCRPLPVAGQPCAEGGQCADSACFVDGMCVAPGDPCNGNLVGVLECVEQAFEPISAVCAPMADPSLYP